LVSHGALDRRWGHVLISSRSRGEERRL
jgi:hypothetical protein